MTTPEPPWKEIEELIAQANDYNTSAEAVAKAATLAFDYVASEIGITGFQASWAALKAYSNEMGYDCPIIVLKAEDLLYPQYNLVARLENWIDDCEPWMIEQAQTKLDEASRYASPNVLAHWQELASRGQELEDLPD